MQPSPYITRSLTGINLENALPVAVCAEEPNQNVGHPLVLRSEEPLSLDSDLVGTQEIRMDHVRTQRTFDSSFQTPSQEKAPDDAR